MKFVILNIIFIHTTQQNSRQCRVTKTYIFTYAYKMALLRNYCKIVNRITVLGEHPAAMHHGQGSIPLCPPIVSAMIVPFLLIFTARDL